MFINSRVRIIRGLTALFLMFLMTSSMLINSSFADTSSQKRHNCSALGFEVSMTRASAESSSEVVVGSVEADGAAEEAGIRVGDCIGLIDNKALSSSNAIQFLRKFHSGQYITLVIERMVDGSKWFKQITFISKGTNFEKTKAVVVKKPFIGAKFSVQDGCLRLESLLASGPAARAGLKIGDVLPDFENNEALVRALEGKRPGRSIEMSILRNSWAITVSITPESKSRKLMQAVSIDLAVPKEKQGYLGIDLGYGDQGLYIDRVMTRSPASLCFLKEDDQICAVNGKSVSRLKDFRRALAGKKPFTPIVVKVLRGRSYIDLPVILGPMPKRYPPTRLLYRHH